ncbi:hypothetical protein BDF19DRAFT_430625 [Syncephalis fuscata]|nr:hypothetical protein BDF19DRAFT_430625 [Syncephalis fuscata]
MVWGNNDNQTAVDNWIRRLHTNDSHFVSLHVMTARRLTADQFAQLFAALADNHTLTQLHCGGHAQSNASLSALAQTLGQHNHTLQSLTLGDRELAVRAPTGFEALCTAIGKNQSLHLLDWGRCGIGAAATATASNAIPEAVRGMLTNNHSLTHVILTENDLTDTTIKSIMAGVKANRVAQGSLIALDLSFNKLGVDFATDIATVLLPSDGNKSKHGLQELNLAGNTELDVTGMTQLGCTLSHPSSLCRKIILSDCYATAPEDNENKENEQGSSSKEVGSKDATEDITPGDAFLSALNETSKDVLATSLALEEIKLDQCGVTAVGANHLAQLLTRPGNRICEVTLRGNTLGDEGASQLAVSVTPLPSAIATATKNTNDDYILTAAVAGISLDLSKNDITDIGLAALLNSSSSITQITLYGNQITLSANIFNQIASWSNNTALTLLDLSSNQVDTSGFERLVDALIAGALPQLRKLELAGNIDVPNDEESMAAWEVITAKLHKARPQTKCLWR